MKTELIMELIKMLASNNEATTSNETTNNEVYPIGQKIIARGYDAGVLFGTLVSVKNGVYRMKDSRRLYYWCAKSGITLEDVAIHGITSESKITSTVPLCDVTDSRISLLIPCSQECINSIESQPNYQP